MTTRLCCILLPLFMLTSAGYTDDRSKMVTDALFEEVQIKINRGQCAALSVGYLVGHLEESDQEAIDRALKLVTLYGSKEPSLYFLLRKHEDQELVRNLLRQDAGNGKWNESFSKSILVDLLYSYYEIKTESLDDKIAPSKQSPFCLDLQLERVSSHVCVAVLNISNQSSRGRYFMNSVSTMDYISIKRADGVTIPAPLRSIHPVVPIFLNPGESITKCHALKFERSQVYLDSLRYMYPSDIKGLQTPFQFFYGSNIPHLDVNGEIIAFGDAPVSLKISAKYNEQELYSKLVANGFDKERMPWLLGGERSGESLAAEPDLTPSAESHADVAAYDWYDSFVITRSDFVILSECVGD